MSDNRIKQIADANGMEVILNKLTEECGELTTGISRYEAQIKLPDEVTAALKYAEMFEEAADVQIMLEQLRLQDEGLFDYYREQKTNRQLERMGKNDKR